MKVFAISVLVLTIFASKNTSAIGDGKQFPTFVYKIVINRPALYMCFAGETLKYPDV